MIVDNFHSAATGGQDLLSSRATQNPIRKAVEGIGVKRVRQIDHTYDVGRVREVLCKAPTTKETGPKIIIAASECMLNKQRRENRRGVLLWLTASGFCAPGLVLMKTCAPAITPAFACSAARPRLSDHWTLRRATTPWPPSAIIALAVAIAAKWRKQPFSAPLFTAPTWCRIQARLRRR